MALPWMAFHRNVVWYVFLRSNLLKFIFNPFTEFIHAHYLWMPFHRLDTYIFAWIVAKDQLNSHLYGFSPECTLECYNDMHNFGIYVCSFMNMWYKYWPCWDLMTVRRPCCKSITSTVIVQLLNISLFQD